jgi:uncharacterized protein HemY
MKNILPIVVISVMVVLGAWVLKLHFAPGSGRPWSDTSVDSSGKPLRKTDTAKQDVNPTHEKAFLEEQLKTNPNHAPILLRLGEVERNMGQLTDARSHLEKAVNADPTMIDARLELSMVCYELKDANEAERQNLLVLKQDPKQPDALYNLGAIEANRNDLAKARDYFQQAVQDGPETASGKNAAMALTKLGGQVRQ